MMVLLWHPMYCVFLKHKIVSDKDGDLLAKVGRIGVQVKTVRGDLPWMDVNMLGALSPTGLPVT